MGKIIGNWFKKEYPQKRIEKGSIFALMRDSERKHYFVYLGKRRTDAIGMYFTEITDEATVIEQGRFDYDMLFDSKKNIIGKINIEKMWYDAIMKEIEPKKLLPKY